MLKQGSYTGNSGTLLRFILHSLTTIWLLLCRRTVKHRKARCDNHQQAFSCFGRNCAEPTKFTLQRWSVRACRSSPTRKARGSNPPGRTKSSTLWGAALFVLHGFYGAVKEGIRTALAPRLGESLQAHQKTLLRCIFCNEVFLFWFFRIILATYHQWRLCTAPAFANFIAVKRW